MKERKAQKRIAENKKEAEMYGFCPYCGTSWDDFNIYPAFWVCGKCSYQPTVYTSPFERQIFANKVEALISFIRDVDNHLKQDPSMNLEWIENRVHLSRFYSPSLNLLRFYDEYSLEGFQKTKEGGVYMDWIEKQYREWERKKEFKKEVYNV